MTTTDMPSTYTRLHMVLSGGRMPEVAADADAHGNFARLEFTTRHGDLYPSGNLTVAFTTSSGGPADLERLLLTALAHVRKLTIPEAEALDGFAAEVACLETGGRAATGSPLPDPEPVGVGA